MKREFILFSILFSIAAFSFSVFGQNPVENSISNAPPNTSQTAILLEKVGRAVQQNLDSMVRVAFTEVVRQQQLKDDAAAKGKPQNFVYESIMTVNQSSATGEKQPIFTRTLKSVDGKIVKNPPSPEISKCEQLNPQPVYENPLAFLLPKNQSQYSFSSGGGEVDLDGRKTLVITVAPNPPSEPLKLVEKDDCFFLSRPLQMIGKIWVDAASFNVVQINWQQNEIFSATIPKKVVKVGIVPLVRPAVTINYDSQNFTIGFRFVKFENPEQTILLPYFSESSWLNRGAKIAGIRTRVDYTRYRLFNTNVQVSDADKDSND